MGLGIVGGMLGAAGIGGGFDVLGGQLAAAQNRQSMRASADLQREFAKHGIQWRMEDAKAAGIHPLAAMGMMPTTAHPMVIGDVSGESFSRAGQGLANAVARSTSQDERKAADLNNELLQANIDLTHTQRAKIASDMALEHAARTSATPGLGIQPQPWTMPFPDSQGTAGNPMAGTISLQAPPVMTNAPGDPSTMAGINPGAELMEMPFGKMYLPSGKGQESPLELWSQMPAYEKWGWIMYNRQVQGRSWMNDFLAFSIAGKTHWTREMDKTTPFPLDRKEKDQLGTAGRKFLDWSLQQKRRYNKRFGSTFKDR